MIARNYHREQQAQGCIVAMAFNTLLAASPKKMAGDVGAFRALTHNLSGSAGIAVATALAFSLLGAMVRRAAVASPAISQEPIAQVNMDKVDFIPNSRLRSLRTTMMLLAVLALLAVVPAGKLSGLRDPEDELSVEDLTGVSTDDD